MRAGTIVASNYFEMARLLGDSFLEQHPNATFVILVVDDLPIPDDVGALEVARLDQLDIAADQLARMKTMYDVMEFSTAVKPKLLQLLLSDDDLACYIDPDIYVYHPFEGAVAVARDCGIVLTPHVLEPIPRDGLAVSERSIMQAGIFNLGFIAVGRSARPFLDWWHDRLLVDAISEIEVGLFTDQRWVDWVPALFDHEICRDPGMNIAWWNIHERELTNGDDGLLSNGQPVRFVHFSGYDPSNPAQLSKHPAAAPRTQHLDGSVIRDLADAYGAALLKRGHQQRKQIAYQWGVADDGLALSSVVRRLYRREVLGGVAAGCEAAGVDSSIPSAFGGEPGRFEAWLMADSVSGEPFSRIELELWAVRPDLQSAFPQLAGPDAERYRHWLLNDPGANEALGGLVRLGEVPTARVVGAAAGQHPPTLKRQVRSVLGRVARRFGLRKGARS